MKKSRWQRFKQGIKDLSMSQQLHAKIIGHIGTIFGLTFAMVFLWRVGLWYFIFFMGFGIFLQVIELIGSRQKYLSALQIEKVMKAQKKQIKEIGGG